MNENGAPKLFIHKPKKGQIKHTQGEVPKDIPPQQTFTPPPPPSASTTSISPPSALVKESFFRRYKYLWPLLITVNLAYGAYLYKRIKNQSASDEEETALATDSVSTAANSKLENSAPSILSPATPGFAQIFTNAEQAALSPAITTPHNVCAIPDEHRRELYKWILDEKRMIKPANAEEKNRIDAEKAVLKHFIRAESVPNV